MLRIKPRSKLININKEIGYHRCWINLNHLCIYNNIFSDTSSMPFYSWYMFNTYHFVLKYLMRPNAWWSPFFRAIFNSLIRFSIYSTKNFSISAYLKFGKQYTKVNIFNYHFDWEFNRRTQDIKLKYFNKRKI